MKELIEKMKEEGLLTAVIERWYMEMRINIQKCCYLSQNEQPYINTAAYKNANLYYENLTGFLYGLEALNYIRPEQAAFYVETLTEQFEF